MLKQLRRWKYLIAVGLIFVCAVFVSQQYQRARKQCSKECEQINPIPVAPSSPCKDRNKCEQDAERNFPSWYRVFSWPEGITTWAILLTLLSIAEQTHETRRSADISERVLVSTFRPKVVVRSITLHPKSTAERPAMTDAPPWIIRVVIGNSGGTAANIQSGKIEIGWLKLPTTIEPIKTEKIAGFILQPGEKQPINIPVIDKMPGGANIGVQLAFVEIAVSRGHEQEGFLLCSGVITYIDDTRIKREMGFDRGYHIESKTFLPSKDAEKEYSD